MNNLAAALLFRFYIFIYITHGWLPLYELTFSLSDNTTDFDCVLGLHHHQCFNGLTDGRPLYITS